MKMGVKKHSNGEGSALLRWSVSFPSSLHSVLSMTDSSHVTTHPIR